MKYLQTITYLYELNEHREKFNVPLHFIKKVAFFENRILLLVEDKNYIFILDPSKNEFLQSQKQIHTEINDEVLDVEMNIFGPSNQMYYGVAFTKFNELTMIKSCGLLMIPNQCLLQQAFSILLDISDQAELQFLKFNEHYLFYSYYVERLKKTFYFVTNLRDMANSADDLSGYLLSKRASFTIDHRISLVALNNQLLVLCIYGEKQSQIILKNLETNQEGLLPVHKNVYSKESADDGVSPERTHHFDGCRRRNLGLEHGASLSHLLLEHED